MRTAAILLTGVIPLALQPGPMAAEAVAERQVDRLLDRLPAGEGEVPGDVELQCHLISLVTDAVTLRAADVASSDSGPTGLNDGGLTTSSPYSSTAIAAEECGIGVKLPFQPRSDEYPRGP